MTFNLVSERPLTLRFNYNHAQEETLRPAMPLFCLLCNPHTRTFKLGISHTAPLSTAISDTRASHHVTQDIVPLVPLVPDAIHHPFAGCADFFMSYRQNHACFQAEKST